jgi:oligopeptide/dipeptide ABC transporter ATP-binding protein
MNDRAKAATAAAAGTDIPVIEVNGLKKYFKTKYGLLHAVDDVSIGIEKGATLGIVGESGCGKSTLGRMLAMLLSPTDGEILYEGRDIIKLSKKQKRKLRTEIQIIFQDPYSSLNPRMTVSQIIAEPIIVNGVLSGRKNIADRVRELMELVGLADRLTGAYPHELDGGRRQRIGIARALSVDPKFIVCDEPVSALDVSIQAQIINLLLDLQGRMDLTYMFITHNLSVVKYISDEIAVMYLGQCVEKAEGTELFANPMHPYTKALLQAIPVANLSTRENKSEIIKGEVTSPVNPVPGCRFASRCSFARDECSVADMEMKDTGGGHLVACVLHGG